MLSVRKMGDNNGNDRRALIGEIGDNNNNNYNYNDNDGDFDRRLIIGENDFIIMPGARFGSEVFYIKKEKQFYLKNKRKKDGTITLNCREQGCNVNVNYNRIEKTMIFCPPSRTHSHTTKETEFERLVVYNEMKAKCSDPNVLSMNTNKSSPVANIYNEAISK